MLCPGFVMKRLRTYEQVKTDAVVGRVIDLGPCKTDRSMAKVNRFTGRMTGSNDLPETKRGYAYTLAGCNMSIKSDFLKNIGGFDPRFERISLREESDVAERIKKHGGKIFYEPSAFIVHLKASYGGCRHEFKSDEIYWAKRCDSLFITKNFPTATWMMFLLSNLMFHFLLRPKYLKLAIKGIFDGRKMATQEPKIKYDIYEV